MQPTSEFELAQKRFKERQRNQFLMIAWFALFCTTMITNVIFGGIVEWWVPLEMFTLIMAVRKLLQIRYSSPIRTIRVGLIEQEMEWLFGEDWHDYTGAQEYIFAQDRIRKRRMERWGFALHLFAFALAVAFAVNMVLFFAKYGQPGGEICLAAPLIWFAFLLVPHLLRVFPFKFMLARREQNLGETLRLELQRMQPEKRKNEDKPKRNVAYTVGDDGELIEVDRSDDKPKRDGL